MRAEAATCTSSPTSEHRGVKLTSNGVADDTVFEPVSLDEIDKRHILRTLEHTSWNKSQAATILKIERSTLDRKIKLYQLRRSNE